MIWMKLTEDVNSSTSNITRKGTTTPCITKLHQLILFDKFYTFMLLLRSPLKRSFKLESVWP